MIIKHVNKEEEMEKERRRDTTVAISGNRKELLNDAVIKFVIDTREQIKMSEIVHYLIDEYLDDGLNDMIQKELKEKTESR